MFVQLAMSGVSNGKACALSDYQSQSVYQKAAGREGAAKKAIFMTICQQRFFNMQLGCRGSAAVPKKLSMFLAYRTQAN